MDVVDFYLQSQSLPIAIAWEFACRDLIIKHLYFLAKDFLDLYFIAIKRFCSGEITEFLQTLVPLPLM